MGYKNDGLFVVGFYACILHSVDKADFSLGFSVALARLGIFQFVWIKRLCRIYCFQMELITGFVSICVISKQWKLTLVISLIWYFSTAYNSALSGVISDLDAVRKI